MMLVGGFVLDTRELLIMYINQEEAGRRIFIPSVVPCQCRCCSCEAHRETIMLDDFSVLPSEPEFTQEMTQPC